jgi:hypothetical protein
MDKLVIEGTEIIPDISFNPESGIMEIRGKSVPENARDFYAPMIKWINSYMENPEPLTEFHIKLDYFNTSSAKAIMNILKDLEKLHNTDNEVVVKWYYIEGDDDLLEAGEDFKSIFNLPFEIIESEDIF